jgi:hypothetical protein
MQEIRAKRFAGLFTFTAIWAAAVAAQSPESYRRARRFGGLDRRMAHAKAISNRRVFFGDAFPALRANATLSIRRPLRIPRVDATQSSRLIQQYFLSRSPCSAWPVAASSPGASNCEFQPNGLVPLPWYQKI